MLAHTYTEDIQDLNNCQHLEIAGAVSYSVDLSLFMGSSKLRIRSVEYDLVEGKHLVPKHMFLLRVKIERLGPFQRGLQLYLI